MRVDLIACTPDAEAVVASAARLCYSPVGVQDIMSKQDSNSNETFIKRLMAMGHDSPLEHMSFTFAIEGVSRVLTHQLVRHRIASYSQQSQRYVKLDAFEYVIPPAIQCDEEARAVFVKSMEQAQEAYDALVMKLTPKYETQFLSEGISAAKAKSMAEKVAIEDARFVFPNACETKIMTTMNARSLLNFFSHRLCQRAQWEIRGLAEAMLERVKDQAPTVFLHVGPPCVHGPCPEGALTCGKINEIRMQYKKK